MKSVLASVLSVAASKGTTLAKVVAAVTGAVAWLNRQSYGAEVKELVRGLTFSVGNIPNLGQSGGTLTITKDAGSFNVYGSTKGNSRFEMTVEGLTKAVETLPQNDEAAKARANAEAEAAKVAAEAARLAAEKAAQAAAEAARKAAEVQNSGFESFVSSVRGFFARA